METTTRTEFAKKIEVVSWEVLEFDENDPGFRKNYLVTVKYRGNDYKLVYQPEEPVYLSGDWALRQHDGITTGPFSLNNESGDESNDLIDALMEDGNMEDWEAVCIIDEAVGAVVPFSYEADEQEGE